MNRNCHVFMAVAFSLCSAGHYLVFGSSIPLTDSMDRFRNHLFLPFVGSSPSGRLLLFLNFTKSAFSVVRIFRLEKISEMDLWKFEKS